MGRSVSVVLAVAVAMCATAAWAQGGERPSRSASGGPGGMGMQMSCPAMAVAVPRVEMLAREAKDLSLTSDQLTKLQEAMKKADETIKPLSEKSAERSKAVREALMASTYDARNVAALAELAVKAEAAIVTARLDEWTQIRSILTADQVTKLKEKMSAQRPGGGAGGFRPEGAPPNGGPPFGGPPSGAAPEGAPGPPPIGE